jgi:copper(I)-binding protein
MEGGVPIPAGETVAFAQGGLHAMFLGLTEAWQDPDGVALTLVFESAGPVEIVLPRAEGPGGHGH